MFGKLIEQELLGSTKKEIVLFDQLHETETYVKYRQSVEFAKSHQRADPINPKRFFPKSLRDGLKEDQSLNITSEDQIAYYTALDTPLDKYHGVDAFFEYKVGEKSILITFDVTTNPSKDGYKADVILAIPQGGLDPNDEKYKELISGYVEQIKSKILTKTSF